MGERSFFLPAARAKVTEAIKAVEAETSAELVVSVRHESASYRAADFLFGFVAALGMLGVLVFHPTEFVDDWMPVDVLVAFAVGAAVCAYAPPLRRLLSPGKRMREAVHGAACACFVRMKVTRTSGRNGILVFVSTFERKADVIADIGIDTGALGEGWARAVLAIEAAAARADFDAFVVALRALGPVLGAAMPHLPDDVNELPDEMDAA